MKIKIHRPASFSETGNRANNEDSVYPPTGSATAADRLFLVCDGVGGEHKGEVASQEACRCISAYLLHQQASTFGPELLRQALEHTIQTFAEIERNDPESAGMATTLTLLYVLDASLAIAHLGDSRIYQVRDGKIIFQTRDHKFVNELVEGGIITEEQARDHPKKNVITRVIRASRQDQADYTTIQDIRPGDYFFLCTDGVLERVYDGLLEYHLDPKSATGATPQELLDAIRGECDGLTNDNYSAYLIQIESVENSAPLGATGDSEDTVRLDQLVANPVPVRKSNGVLFTIGVLIGLLVFGSTAYYFLQPPKNKAADPDTLTQTASHSTPLTGTNAMTEIAESPAGGLEQGFVETAKPVLNKRKTEKPPPAPVSKRPPRGELKDTLTKKVKEAQGKDQGSSADSAQNVSPPATSDSLGKSTPEKIKTEKRVLLKRERKTIPPKVDRE